MFSSTRNWKNWVYNQNTINKFGPDCAEVSIAQILGINYDIWLSEAGTAKAVTEAREAGILTDDGAVFETIYEWNAKMAQEITGEEVEVFKTYIGTFEFKEALKIGYGFGLGLINGNNSYLDAVDSGEITTDDIDNISIEGGGFGHNHVYGIRNGEYGIFEVYRGTFVKCSLDVLEYGLSKGIYYSPARTILFKDFLLEDALFDYKNEVNIENVQDLPEERQKVIGRASKLRVFKK